MPYIKDEERPKIDLIVEDSKKAIKKLTDPQFAYLTMRIALNRNMRNHEEISNVIKILRNVAHEIERRILDEYEDMKRDKNGDVI